MSEYIENISIKVSLDTSKAISNLEELTSKVGKLTEEAKKLSNQFSNSFAEIAKQFAEIAKQSKNTSEEIENTFSKSARKIKYIFGSIGGVFGSTFKNIVGYDSINSLLKHYVETNQRLEWFENSNKRRATANTRSNIIIDRLTKMTQGNGYVGTPGGFQYYYDGLPQNSYDRNVFDKSNYFPGSNRWKIANYKYPFDENDRRIVEEFSKSLNNVRYQFETITQSVARSLLPVLTRMLNIVGQLAEESKIFKTTLTIGIWINQTAKLANMVINISNAVTGLNKALAITKTLGIFGKPLFGIVSKHPLASLAVGALGLGGLGYGVYKNFKNKHNLTYNSMDENYLQNRYSEQFILPRPGNLGLYSGVNDIMNSYNNSRSNSIVYNIDTVQVKTDSRNVPDLMNSVSRMTSNYNNTLLMNNANYGGIY